MKLLLVQDDVIYIPKHTNAPCVVKLLTLQRYLNLLFSLHAQPFCHHHTHRFLFLRILPFRTDHFTFTYKIYISRHSALQADVHSKRFRGNEMFCTESILPALCFAHCIRGASEPRVRAITAARCTSDAHYLCEFSGSSSPGSVASASAHLRRACTSVRC